MVAGEHFDTRAGRLMGKTEIDKIRDIFRRNREQVFIIDAKSGATCTYSQLEELSLKCASLLREKGISKGDRIAAVLGNCIELELLYFACMHLGAIIVPVNPRLKSEEIDYIVSNSGAKLIFIMEGMMYELEKSYARFFPVDSDFLELIKKQNSQGASAFQASDEEVFMIIYTSGTTKFPKGVTVTYKNIIKNGSTFVKFLGMPKGLRFYNVLALAYLGGIYNLTFIPFLAEGSIVLEEPFSAKLALNFWKNIIKFNVSALWFTPSIISTLLALDRSGEGVAYSKNIKLALVGTAPLSIVLKKKFEEKYAITLYENYGLSETFFITSNSPLLKSNRGVGKTLPGCEVHIVDENAGRLGVGKTGEVVAKTEYATAGYYKNDEETTNTIRNGMVYTGDIGYINSQGYLSITGRKKDMIKRGGIAISPKEIEECILSGGLADEVAVVGIPEELAGERIVAFVIQNKDQAAKKDKAARNPDEAQIIAHCKLHLADFKVPEKVVFVNDFPRSVTGKVQKNKLKETFA